jgi:putative transcriptional regulator
MKPQYRSDLDASIHEAAGDLFEIGLISPRTMRQFDKDCLTEVTPLSPAEIAELRHHAGQEWGLQDDYLF